MLIFYNKITHKLGKNMLENSFLYFSILIIIILIFGYAIYLIKKTIYIKKVVSPVKFSNNVRDGYIELLNLLYHNSNHDELENEIKNIAIYKTDGRYVGGYTRKSVEFDSLSFTLDYFYDLLIFLEGQESVFILTLSTNDTVEELNKQLRLALGNLIEIIPFLNKNNLLENKRNINRNILMNYQQKLLNTNIQMAFIDDGSDSYNIILHAVKKEKEVRKAISLIGFQYSKELKLPELV